MFQFFERGGIFMIPLIVCSIVAIALILERGFTLMRRRVISSRLASVIDQLQPGQDIDIVVKVARQDKSTLAGIVRVALDHLAWPKSENVEAVQSHARKAASDLDRGIVVLEILTGVAPLLGLLGTVSGLIKMFGDLSSGKVALAAQSQAMFLSRGIAEALNCTVMGLVVAIPALIAYSYYSKRVETMAIEMEAIVSDLVAKMYRSNYEEAGSSFQASEDEEETDDDEQETPSPKQKKK
ncbi:MAG: MotA/TolQ/ExbB proton channel family protein [Verrucomicrobiae bacterium]|nr:MotA/TolQ/ExbB proton channel family protein [Verrucomicrobiae bacterium]